MQSPRPHPSPPESEPAFQQDPQVIPTSTLPFEKQRPGVTLGMSSEWRMKILLPPATYRALSLCSSLSVNQPQETLGLLEPFRVYTTLQ